jgi:hypothetical protein
MAKFQTNLLRDHVMPPRQRKRFYRGMLMYLAICGVVFVFVVYRATWSFLRAAQQRTDMQRLEREFQAEHPDESSLLAYAEDVRGEAAALTETLQNVDTTLTRRKALGALLSGLVQPLPEGTRLIDFNLDRKKNQVSFDLASLLTIHAGQLPDTTEFVRLWNQDPRLNGSLEDIKAVSSKRMTMEGQPVFVIKFSATLKRGRA